MIVCDAATVVASLLHDGPARQIVATEQVQAPHLLDAEVSHVLRARVLHRGMDPGEGWRLLDVYRWMAITRHGIFAMFDRIWELRDNVTAYDAAYVALAEAIECPLVTADARLSRAPGLRCAVTVVPG
ncbi:MAG TPA: type II toxin-antitoxin system VapC family toxin [Propionibacteriaceae bacterium]|nr:type II toxin-antitoxin system VapC family toxin [Propionibacteriaceae bacterium]